MGEGRTKLNLSEEATTEKPQDPTIVRIKRGESVASNIRVSKATRFLLKQHALLLEKDFNRQVSINEAVRELLVYWHSSQD